MLGIVDHEQHVLALQFAQERIADRFARSFGDVQRRSNRLRDERGIADRAQVDEPGAVGKAFDRGRRHLQRETRFADAPGSRDRDQAVLDQQLLHVVEFALASDETRDL